jgi:hypothetical protein
MRRERVEIAMVIATGALHVFVSEVLGATGPFAVVATLFWIAYVAWRLRTPGQARAWGMRLDTLRASAVLNGVLVAIAGTAMVAYGSSQGRHAPLAKLAFLFVAYPIWGAVQQLMVCGLVFANLRALLPRGAALVTTLLFAAVHIPDVPLVALTAASCLVWTTLWARAPNLWVHGVAHGWLATLAYFFVLGRDPWP